MITGWSFPFKFFLPVWFSLWCSPVLGNIGFFKLHQKFCCRFSFGGQNPATGAGFSQSSMWPSRSSEQITTPMKIGNVTRRRATATWLEHLWGEEGQKLRFGDKKTPNDYVEDIPLPDFQVSMFHYWISLCFILMNFYSQAFEPQVIRPGRNGMTNWRPARRNPSCATIGAWRCLVWVGGGWQMRFLQFLWLMRKRMWAWSAVEYELVSAAKLWFEGVPGLFENFEKGPKAIPKSWLILHPSSQGNVHEHDQPELQTSWARSAGAYPDEAPLAIVEHEGRFSLEAAKINT